MRVVLDTGLVVRAVGDKAGLGRDILRRALSDAHTLVLSNSLFAEIRKVLHYPHLRRLHGLDDKEIQDFLDYLVAGSEPISVLSYHIGPLVGLDPTFWRPWRLSFQELTIPLQGTPHPADHVVRPAHRENIIRPCVRVPAAEK